MNVDESGRTTALIGSIWRYMRILVCILAAVGLCLIVGLQSGWLGIVTYPSPALVEALAKAGSLGGPTLKVTGPKNLFSNETVVDTGRTYRLEADVRVLPKEDGTAQTSFVYFGVSTYDANGNELRSPPGTYRYAGGGRRIGSDQGWVHLSGNIGGEGNESHHQFRPGTRSVKLVLLANYQSKDDPVLLIRDVMFSEFFELVP